MANRRRLWALLGQTVRIWWRWLSRRSQCARLKWEAMSRLLKRYRLYTRYLCEFAAELWPDADLSWLRGQA